MMDKTEFIKKLSEKFPRDLTASDIDDLSKWLERNVDLLQLEDLYWNIVERYEYKTFPNISFIAKCRPSTSYSSTDPVVEHCRKVYLKQAEWKKMLVRDILKRYMECRKNLYAAGATILDKEFIHAWDGLYSEYSICRDLGMKPDEIQRHCEYVKDAIVNDKPYESIRSKPVFVPGGDRKEKIISVGQALKEVL